MKRPAKVSGTAAVRQEDLPTDMRDQYPILLEHLTQDTWEEDGKPRERSTITLCYSEGSLKVCLNDREFNRSCFRSGKSLAAALASLEKGLAQDTLDWRTWSPKRKER